VNQILGALATLLAVDSVTAMSEVVPTLAAAARPDKAAAAPDRAKLFAFREMLCSQQTALEVLANFVYVSLRTALDSLPSCNAYGRASP
jgi:hypothetical protein